MKLMHLGDLHIGKRVHEFSMLEDQTYILNQILDMVDTEQPDCVLIAGDVYDKPIPPAEATKLLDTFLTELVKRKVAVFLISGNHDSATRLDFGSRLLEDRELYIAGTFQGELQHIVKEDAFGEVHFYLLPFVKPAIVASYFPEDAVVSYQDGIQTVVKHTKIDETKRNVIVSHQFVTWKGIAEESDSETVSLGSIDHVDATVFFPFDYTALGHLHSPQRIGKDTIRYAGSPLAYSFSEIRRGKSVTLVDLQEKGNIDIKQIPLEPLHPLGELCGGLEELLEEGRKNGGSNDYMRVVLTDEKMHYDPLGKLRNIYPNIMTLDIMNTGGKGIQLEKFTLEKNKPEDMFADFFLQQTNKELDDTQRVLVQKIWQNLGGDGR
ncbi:exonuclease SbcCD subunit D [Chakrabartyella piscis]|uniref:exonuclease SbcCD subunit D n=1 Tax=Chakrabartyella piscis TaxID=2918914 RepID=UPI002958AA1A|nr:exonuclease SbcCD subunit D [Chakrabartyella piscis]